MLVQSCNCPADGSDFDFVGSVKELPFIADKRQIECEEFPFAARAPALCTFGFVQRSANYYLSTGKRNAICLVQNQESSNEKRIGKPSPIIS
jgi:hypothetical protein